MHLAGIFVNPCVNPYPFSYPWQQKNGMGTINTHIFAIDGAHGILPLPKNTMSALNRICSEPGLLKIPCGPWHLGRAQALARAQGCPGVLGQERNAMGAINGKKKNEY